MPERGRPRRARRAGVWTLVALLPAIGSARGTDQPVEGWSVERLDRVERVAAGAGIEVRNRFGDVRVRVGEPGRVKAHAVIQRDVKDPRRADLDTVATDNGTRLSVVLDSDGVGDPEPGWERRRVDLAVAVPPGVRLRVETVAGLIEVKGGVGALEAVSEKGDVQLWIDARAQVRTERGSIVAELLGESWSEAARFETVTGSIEVEMPARAEAKVRAETSGRLTTDYSIEVEWLGQRRKRATARLGAGGPEVLLESESGDVAILRRLPSGRSDERPLE